MGAPFLDRTDAGHQLAEQLRHYANREDVIVLALPRGGVPVAYEVAHALHAPLDIFLVRKLGVPGHEELAMGAIASGGVKVLNHGVVRAMRIPEAAIDAAAAREMRELERREREYRDGRPPADVRGRTVILVDDGLATGATMLAAVNALRREGAARIVVAVPVSSKRACAEFRHQVDEVVCAEMPDDFQSVGEWYYDFSQTTDAEVRNLLARASQESPVAHSVDR
jgi:putative phosphoribosyl transferase